MGRVLPLTITCTMGVRLSEPLISKLLDRSVERVLGHGHFFRGRESTRWVGDIDP